MDNSAEQQVKPQVHNATKVVKLIVLVAIICALVAALWLLPLKQIHGCRAGVDARSGRVGACLRGRLLRGRDRIFPSRFSAYAGSRFSLRRAFGAGNRMDGSSCRGLCCFSRGSHICA